MMIKFMTSVILLLCSCVVAEAQHNAKSGKWNRVSDPYNHEYVEAATAAIREVMEQNFQAHAVEDLKALMATMTSNCPDRENFMRECKQMFDDTDVYIRLVDCRWITSWRDSQGLWAAVEIKQWTVPKDEDLDYSEYRHRSGLLPKWELCEYQLFARVENGQWKAHVINGNVHEAHWPEERPADPREDGTRVKPAAAAGGQPAAPAAAIAEKNCADGSCPAQWPNTPHVRPRMTTLQNR
jgi:hypothetical protein